MHSDRALLNPPARPSPCSPPSLLSSPIPLPFPPPGVLTKLDIMDRGTDAVAVLKNEAVPLALGFVGVVLRSQEDIANRRTMGDARGAERAFFEAHPEYLEVAPQVGGGVCGVFGLGFVVCAGRQVLRRWWVVGKCDAWLGGRQTDRQQGPRRRHFTDPPPPPAAPRLRPALQCGVGHLARVLNSLLVEHIRGLLPSLRHKIEEAVGARRRELAMYGDAPPGSSSAARGGLLLTILDSYASRFRWVCGWWVGAGWWIGWWAD